ncbi:hypothetical protein ACFYU8_05905 [Brevibacillus sp. NPDC003359]|uniref:hypothetical protein n=1 Tax=unclassified Brevibacillus TaxID=2684853 RepID=UPI00368FDA8E
MTETKKRAYKKLISQALLDIKNTGQFSEENFQRNFRIAHAFHNLAQYIVLDFEGFDEDEFWKVVSALADQFDLHHYSQIFEETVMER